MKPGPLISTDADTSSSEAAATTSAATSRGARPTRFASGMAPLAWKSARSEARSTGSAPGTIVSKAVWRRWSSTLNASGISHCRIPRAVLRSVPGGISVGRRPHRPVGQPVAMVRTEESLLEQPIADDVAVAEPGHVIDDAVLGQPLYLRRP